MSSYTTNHINTQNELLLNNLMEFYKNRDNLHKMMHIINGETKISLRIVDWFVTNYAKKYYIVYEIPLKKINGDVLEENIRFKVYNDYKLKLKAYSKKRFDPFCRWERISIPYDNEKYMETTIGQLNFFKWGIENNIIDFIEHNYDIIERDMNLRNSTSKRKQLSLKSVVSSISSNDDLQEDNQSSHSINGKTRKKREELSVSACKCIKKEMVKIIVKFN